jgi:NAD(P)-dependent dehydrogenase (short-subunit alcohol dehydrogenase family)
MIYVVFGMNGIISEYLRAVLTELKHDFMAFGHGQCDCTMAEEVRDAIAQAWSTYGAVDAVVNCVGAPGLVKPSLGVSPSEFMDVVRNDVLSAWNISVEAARYMVPRKSGSIVHVSSMHAVATYPQRAAYSTAKSGVCGLVRALAIEWAQWNVRVNAICPGQVIGSLRTKKILETDEDDVLERAPGQRLVEPLEVAQGIRFLSENAGMNGVSLMIDSGWTVSGWFKAHGKDY